MHVDTAHACTHFTVSAFSPEGMHAVVLTIIHCIASAQVQPSMQYCTDAAGIFIDAHIQLRARS
jgi:hypothetical protein